MYWEPEQQDRTRVLKMSEKKTTGAIPGLYNLTTIPMVSLSSITLFFQEIQRDSDQRFWAARKATVAGYHD